MPEDSVFCAACDVSVLPIVDGCQRCALPATGWASPPASPHGSGCAGCHRRPLRVDGARSLFVYGGAVTRAILRCKHGDRPDVAARLGRLVGAALAEQARQIDVVAPVPLHSSRLRRRGFNQAWTMLLAARAFLPDAVRGTLRLNATLLTRTRATPALGHESPEERRRLVDRAFVATDPEAVTGQRVLLLDDVLTTGATADACSDALRDAGAEKTHLLVLARAV